MGDIEEYSENLQRSLSRLQSSLAARLEAGVSGCHDAYVLELRNKVDELTARNASLESELQVLRTSCAGWRATCVELIDRLNASVDLVRAILRKGKEKR